MPTSRDSSAPDRIDLGAPGAAEDLAKRLDATPSQIEEAVKAVGNRIGDIEMHLKGSRSTSNEERMEQAPPSGAKA